MTINEAIAHADAQAHKCHGTDCGNEHAELARWLRELRTLRETGANMTTEENTLKQLADLAHCGGLAGLTEAEALTAIRRLTPTHWDKGRHTDAMTLDTLVAFRASKAAVEYSVKH
jgi:hypothetical protein